MSQSNLTNNRRSFLKKAAAGAAAGALLPLSAASCATTARNSSIEACDDARCNVKLGVCTYSYWHFSEERTPIEFVIEEASRLGAAGVDVLHRQMESEDASYIRRLKRHALENGVTMHCLSTHQSFVSPNPERRQRSVDDTIRFIRLAHDMGIPCIRISAGRWGTSGSFSELMDNKGIEPPLDGYTEDDAFEWVNASLERIIPTAESLGITLGLENHWGMTRTAEGIMRIKNAIDSPWLGVLLDTGNFLERTYEQMEMLAPYVVFVQAKTYYGGGRFYTLDIDYDRVASILGNAGYKGYIAVEFEGYENSAVAVEKSIQLLRDSFTPYY